MSSALKRDWRDFICSSTHGGRFFASIGSGVSLSTATPIEREVLDSLLHRLSGAESDVRLLANVVDLMRADYASFVGIHLHRVLDHLSNEMVRMDEIVGPALRGNPRWDRTLLGRLSGNLPPGRYVSRTAYRSFELSENILLRWLVKDLLEAVHYVGRRIGAAHLPPQLQTLVKNCEFALRHHWLSAIPDVEVPSEAMIISAKRHRRSEYRKAATLATRRKGLSVSRQNETSRWMSVLMLLSVNWLEPVDDDDLFELYALALVLDVLEQELGFGTPSESGLITRGRRHVARFESDTCQIFVHFDQSLSSSIGAKGKYSEVIASHNGLSGYARRPDITIRQESSDGRRLLFIEVKKSRDSTYLSDSLYKAFAYLYDHSEIWDMRQMNPRIVLLVPENVSMVPGTKIPEVAFVSSGDRATFSRVLGEALNS